MTEVQTDPEIEIVEVSSEPEYLIQEPPLASSPTAVVAPPKEEPPEENFIDLTRAIKRRKVKLPTEEKPTGEVFEIRLIDDFGVGRQQQMLSYTKAYDRLFSREVDEPLSDDEVTKLEFYLNEMFNAVLVAPAEVKRSMDDSTRQRVVTTFSRAPLIAQIEEEQRRLDVVKVLVDKKVITQKQADEATDEVQKNANQISTN